MIDEVTVQLAVVDGERTWSGGQLESVDLKVVINDGGACTDLGVP